LSSISPVEKLTETLSETICALAVVIESVPASDEAVMLSATALFSDKVIVSTFPGPGVAEMSPPGAPNRQ
jgi:hypothetical protein